MQIICSRVRPRPLFLKNCNQRFEPLAKRVALVSLYQNIDPKRVNEISSECVEMLQLAGAIGVHGLVPVLI